MALSSNSTTRLGSRMPRLVESVRRALAPHEKACLLAQKFEVKGCLPVKGIAKSYRIECFAGLLATNSWRSQDALQIKT